MSKTLFLIKLSGLLILAFSVPIASAQVESLSASRQIKEIDAYAESIDKYVEKQQAPNQILADFSNMEKENSESIWKSFKTESELEKARESTESYTIAFIWRIDGKPVRVNFTYSSPSGDWAHYVHYTFRPDGTTAKIESELLTFYGDAKVERILYYNEKGVRIASKKEVLDLHTGQSKKIEDLFEPEIKYYSNLVRLPFYSLLVS